MCVLCVQTWLPVCAVCSDVATFVCCVFRRGYMCVLCVQTWLHVCVVFRHCYMNTQFRRGYICVLCVQPWLHVCVVCSDVAICVWCVSRRDYMCVLCVQT